MVYLKAQGTIYAMTGTLLVPKQLRKRPNGILNCICQDRDKSMAEPEISEKHFPFAGGITKTTHGIVSTTSASR